MIEKQLKLKNILSLLFGALFLGLMICYAFCMLALFSKMGIFGALGFTFDTILFKTRLSTGFYIAWIIISLFFFVRIYYEEKKKIKQKQITSKL